MTLADVQDLLGMWEEEPPMFVLLARIEAMLAAWLGVRRSVGPERPSMPGLDEAAMAQSVLMQAAQGAPGQFMQRAEPSDDGAIYDFGALKARHAG